MCEPEWPDRKSVSSDLAFDLLNVGVRHIGNVLGQDRLDTFVCAVQGSVLGLPASAPLKGAAVEMFATPQKTQGVFVVQKMAARAHAQLPVIAA